MDINKPGERKKLLLAVDTLKKNRPNEGTTSLGIAATSPAPPPITTSTPTTHSNQRPSRADPSTIAGEKVRAPARCTNCHRYKEKKHSCNAEDACTSFSTCPTQHMRLHPEERRRKANENAKKRKIDTDKKKEAQSKEKEEQKSKKQKINEMLRVGCPPSYDAYFEKRVDELSEKDPTAYSKTPNDPRWLKATETAVLEWAQLQQKNQAQKKLVGKLKKLKKDKDIDEQYSLVFRAIGDGLDTEKDITAQLLRLQAITEELEGTATGTSEQQDTEETPHAEDNNREKIRDGGDNDLSASSESSESQLTLSQVPLHSDSESDNEESEKTD